MSEIPASHLLVDRLARLRSRVRLVLSLHGIGLVIAAAVAAAILLALGDWLFHFTAATRVIFIVTTLVVLGIIAYKKLVAPLSTKLTDQFLASRVENKNKQLADELISAVHFVKTGTIKTSAIAARHVEDTQTKTANVSFEEALDFRTANRTLAVAAIFLLVAFLVGFSNPALSKLLFGRWIAFDSTAEWPRLTTVQFAWDTPDGKQPAVLPIGEQFLVRAKVTKGGYQGLRASLYSSTDTQPDEVRELMTFQTGAFKDGLFIYERSIEPVGNSSLNLRVESGDHKGSEAPSAQIRLAPRPIITEIVASITPPPYVKNAADPTKPAQPVVIDLLSQAGRAVEGARVALRIKSTKPFLVDGRGRPAVQFFDQVKDTELKLDNANFRLLEPNVAEVSFAARQTLQARALMRDADGFENRIGGTLSLEVVPDAMPTVVITEPRRMVERQDAGSVEITVQANDDQGLDGLKIVAEKFDAKPGDAPVFTAPINWSERTVDAAVGSTTGKATFNWDLTPLKLQPGTRLSFYVMVLDNFQIDAAAAPNPLPKMMVPSDGNTVRHDWVRSAPLSLQIRTQEEVAEAARKQLNEIREQIMNLKKQQDQTKAQTDAIEKSIAESGTSTNQQKNQLSELAQAQAQQSSAANAIQQRTEQVRQELDQNKLAETDLGKLAENVSDGMKDVGTNNMPKATSELSKAAEAAGSEASSSPSDPSGKNDKQDPNSKSDKNDKKDPAAKNDKKDATAKNDKNNKNDKKDPSNSSSAKSGSPESGSPESGSPESGSPESGSPSKSSPQSAQSAKKASKQQQEAIDKMDKMIDKLGEAGEFAAAKGELKDIQDKQEKLTKETRETMAQTAGKPRDQLSNELKAKLDALAAKQSELAKKTAALKEKMEKASEKAAKSGDQATAESLANAAKAEQSNEVSQSQSSAAASASKNQSSSTSNSQSKAQSGLQQMMDELEKQDQRQLEQLSRELADMLKQLQQLLGEETQINKETVDAGEKAVKKILLALGDRQGRTHQNTIIIQKKAENTKDAQKAARDIQEAADYMGTAAGALYGNKQPDALQPELDAIASIQAAIKKLEKQKEEVDEKLKEKDLAQFIKEYEAIRASQIAIKAATDKIEANRLAAEDKQLTRMDSLTLGGLAGTPNVVSKDPTQLSVKEQINGLSNEEKLKEYEVVIWMNKQIADYMDKSRDLMTKSKTGRSLAMNQQTSIDRITDIIEALKEEKNKEKEFKEESGGGGGGGGGGGKPPLIPPVAQLKLLKAMQKNINNQTTSVNNGLKNAASDTDKAELKGDAAKLGQQQGDVKDLAAKVMEKLKR